MELRNHLVFTITAVVMYIASKKMIDAAALNGSSEIERILNGKRAQPGEFRYACALFRNGKFSCSCSVIGPTTILTAAHCVQNRGETYSAESLHAISNVDKQSSEVRVDFASVTPHPNYTESGYPNDIAVLKATESIPFNDNVNSTCIASNNTKLMQYEKGTAMGYGDTTGTGGLDSRYLRHVEQEIRDNDECATYYFGSRPDDCKICGGRRQLGGICPGDSGGPLVTITEQPNIQLGIASYGLRFVPCGTVAPAVWTRVSCFEDFIKSVAGEDICVV